MATEPYVTANVILGVLTIIIAILALGLWIFVLINQHLSARLRATNQGSWSRNQAQIDVQESELQLGIRPRLKVANEKVIHFNEHRSNFSVLTPGYARPLYRHPEISENLMSKAAVQVKNENHYIYKRSMAVEVEEKTIEMTSEEPEKSQSSGIELNLTSDSADDKKLHIESESIGGVVEPPVKLLYFRPLCSDSSDRQENMTNSDKLPQESTGC